MVDREKVIYSIERCTCHVPDACRDCAYDAGHPYNECVEMMLKDALSLLKAQEPRVMAWEELSALSFDTPVFIEENSGECGWNVFCYIDEENDVCFCGFKASADYYDLEEYGESWRCWTSRPTDEQRKAVKWDENNRTR